MSKTPSSHAAAAPKGWAAPATGNTLLALAGLSFYAVCILLPLVGPAAARGSGSPGATRAAHYPANFAVFLSALLLTLFLSALAWYAKARRRRLDGGPRPKAAPALTMLCALLLWALLGGWLSI